MACFWLHQNDTTINISEVEEIGGVTYYKIDVRVGEIQWRVLHRYNDFYDLHNALVVDHGVAKDMLPPKKVIRNKCPNFVDTRRQGLEIYLRNVLNYLKRTMPRIFIEFLDFHICDIFFMLQNLAFQFYFEADLVLSSSKSYTFNPLQLHAITECFKKPFPEMEQSDKRYDLSHVMDFCSQLQNLYIVGCSTKFKTSNIVPNQLPFEMSTFKALELLEIRSINLEHVYSMGNLRNSLLIMRVHKTGITNISQILQCDVLHKSVVDNAEVWASISELDFSNNNLTDIDESIRLVPNVKILKLNHNKISSISDLSSLTRLTHLSISDNLINLSQNSISSLKGFSKLYSLETLVLSFNKVNEIEEANYIGDLPCLENLNLMGNAVAGTVDYRVKVLEPFGDRAKEICLDNEKPSQSEIDKVSILKALRIVKEGDWTPVVMPPSVLGSMRLAKPAYTWDVVSYPNIARSHHFTEPNAERFD
ncbi:hypothetical protein FQR65_LT12274 [Abscondita terminalis]|nr:hypothetical protein FQR65_LT12274 [Abscondita terminalis]